MRARPWTNAEIKLLGTLPDGELGRRIGRRFGTVWQKREALGIPQPHVLQHPWTVEEDTLILSHPIQEAVKLIDRTRLAIKMRKTILLQKLASNPKKFRTQAKALEKIQVPRFSSAVEEERFQLVGGPYYPPRISIGGYLECDVNGSVQVGDWTHALIPWPVKQGAGRSLILCGDFVKALRTESRQAVSFHFGLSLAVVSKYRSMLGIERYTAGSWRLFRRTINLARTPEAREKISRKMEGKRSNMSPKDRRRLKAIQRQPKPLSVRRKMSERQRRKFRLLGPNRKWTAEELALIGTMRDVEVAKRTGRTLLAVRHRKFLMGKQPIS